MATLRKRSLNLGHKKTLNEMTYKLPSISKDITPSVEEDQVVVAIKKQQ